MSECKALEDLVAWVRAQGSEIWQSGHETGYKVGVDSIKAVTLCNRKSYNKGKNDGYVECAERSRADWLAKVRDARDAGYKKGIADAYTDMKWEAPPGPLLGEFREVICGLEEPAECSYRFKLDAAASICRCGGKEYRNTCRFRKTAVVRVYSAPEVKGGDGKAADDPVAHDKEGNAI